MVKLNYPDTFDIRDWANDLQYLQMAKASGIKSETFNKELDKQIAEAVIDDSEMMKTINDEIDATRTVRGAIYNHRSRRTNSWRRRNVKFLKIKRLVFQRNIFLG